MLSSSKLALSIYNDLDQNAFTSWHNDSEILENINEAINFVSAYAKRPWNLYHEEIILPNSSQQFTAWFEIFHPYWVYLDEQEQTISNIPMLPSFDARKESGRAYIWEKIIQTSETWKKINILYHKWHNAITSLWNDDINIPRAMKKAIHHIALRFSYPSGLEIWASLANQHFQMATTILDTYAKAYWDKIQPKSVQASRIYN